MSRFSLGRYSLADEKLGCSIEDGKPITKEVYKIIIDRQLDLWVQYCCVCPTCDGLLPIKDSRTEGSLRSPATRQVNLSSVSTGRTFRWSSNMADEPSKLLLAIVVEEAGVARRNQSLLLRVHGREN